jgi:glycosyltransferase involved in cell wall biosynthesis
VSSVHVFVPTYGPAPYLDQALRSALAARRDGVAITVVDDGSPVPVAEGVVERLRSEGHDLELVRLPENLGVAGAFNRCVELSRGDRTVILGDDDLLEPWYVDEVRGLLRRFGDVAMAMPWVTVIDAEGTEHQPLADRVKSVLARRHRMPVSLGGQPLAVSLLTGDWLYFPAIAWRTADLRAHPFRTDLGTAMDYEVELRLVLDGARLAVSGRPSFRYRRHDASVSSRTAASGERFGEQDEVFAWAAQRCDDLGWRWAAMAARLHATSRAHDAVTRISRTR